MKYYNIIELIALLSLCTATVVYWWLTGDSYSTIPASLILVVVTLISINYKLRKS